jgi:hypothetical protein
MENKDTCEKIMNFALVKILLMWTPYPKESRVRRSWELVFASFIVEQKVNSDLAQ